MSNMSGYQFKWTLIWWEMPLDTREARSAARRFKRRLFPSKMGPATLLAGNMRKGAALCSTNQARVKEMIGELPPDSRVAMLGITDKQYGLASVRWGAVRKAPR